MSNSRRHLYGEPATDGVGPLLAQGAEGLI